MKIIILNIILTLSLFSSSSSDNSQEDFTISIVHMNDIHSHLEEEFIYVNIDKKSTKLLVGGYPRVATAINKMLLDKPNSLLLHAGDELQGTLYYTLFSGDADAAMMNMLPWNAFAIGNHEFDDGDKNLADFLSKVKAPVISANVIPDNDDVLHKMWNPYIIKIIDGHKVAIIGVTVKKKTEESSNPSDKIKFYDEIKTMQSTVESLKVKGINKIIVLSHYGYDNDKILASKVDGIDVIVGGDSHTLLGNFSNLGLKSGGDYPTKVLSKTKERVCIVQAWSYSKVVGNLDVSFDLNGLVTECSGVPILVVGDTFLQNKVEVNATTKIAILDFVKKNENIGFYEKDAAVESVLQEYKSQVVAKSKEVVGEVGYSLYNIRVPDTSYNGVNLPLGSEVAPIVAKSFYDSSLRSDASIVNAGGVRTNLEEGKISINTAYTLLPFSDTLYELEMSGAEVKQVLEDAVARTASNSSNDGSFPYAYALRYDVKMSNKTGNRVLNLEIKNRKTSKWSAINPNNSYVISTLSYLASGKDGYETFQTVQKQKGKGVDTYLDYALSFVKYVKAKKAIGEKVIKLPSKEHCIKSFTK